jgi:hypothetical protein
VGEIRQGMAQQFVRFKKIAKHLQYSLTLYDYYYYRLDLSYNDAEIVFCCCFVSDEQYYVCCCFVMASYHGFITFTAVYRLIDVLSMLSEQSCLYRGISFD